MLLHAIDQGDSGASFELLPLVYEELRSRAGKLLSGERSNHTLQRTALVHEAYLKLVRGEQNFQTRAHFFNAAALAMRRILVNHAVERRAHKRGGGRAQVNLDDVDIAGDAVDSVDVLDWIQLDDALKQLAEASPRQHKVVMLRFYAGRTEAEVAELLGVSLATVERDWKMARAWLYRAMKKE